jgi:hypothetical protein
MSNRPKCKQTKADGSSCGATATPSGFCWFHCPSLAAQRDEARKRGGQQTRRRRLKVVVPADVPDLPLRDVADVTALLGQTINEVRRGQLDPKAANCIGVLAGVLLRALQDGREDAVPEKPAPLDMPPISEERRRKLLDEVRARHGLPPVGPLALPGPAPATKGEAAVDGA